MSIQEILESAGLPAQRGVYTGRDKPDAYYTFLRLLGTPAVNADDEEKERREMYRVTLFHKGDFEAQLDKTKEVLKAEAGTKETKEAIAALDERLKRVESGWGIDYKHDAVLGLCYMGAAYMSQHYERTVETAVLGATYVGNSYLANTF